MIVERKLSSITRHKKAVVSVGTYDGVHLGHQALLRYLLKRSSLHEGQSVVVTFDPHPREVVAQKETPLLTTIDERAALLRALGIDRMIVIPFTKAFANLSPEAFVSDYLVGRIGLHEIVIGYDHGFGKGRAGDHRVLQQLGKEHGFTVDVIPAQVLGEVVISSTEIRHALAETGDVAHAARLMGHPYALTGVVEYGDARGKSIGFPTANLAVMHPRKIIPRRGVYAVYVQVHEEGPRLAGMMNIGIRPTFEGTEQRMEVHLIDWEGDLYGQRLQVEFVERVRNERKFDGIEQLVEQLYADKVRCSALLNSGALPTNMSTVKEVGRPLL